MVFLFEGDLCDRLLILIVSSSDVGTAPELRVLHYFMEMSTVINYSMIGYYPLLGIPAASPGGYARC